MEALDKYEKVNKCDSITALSAIIISFADSDGMIQGRERKFNAERMANNAQDYFAGRLEPNCLTREFGIRQQAMYLKYYNLA